MSDSKTSIPGPTLGIQEWPSSPRNAVSIVSVCRFPADNPDALLPRRLSTAAETLPLSPSAPKPGLRIPRCQAVQSFPSHPSLHEQGPCECNKEKEPRTVSQQRVCSHTPLVGHTLSNVRVLVQECHRGLLPRTRPL